ncbi:MAG: hypothetical protein FWE37_03545 [Spirochaetaceae bacterium]|nr:hypothetical protein [Spirochaetaceae bacterium]
MSQNLRFYSSAGELLIANFSFHSLSDIKSYAHSAGFTHDSDDEAAFYCRMLLQNSCTIIHNNEQLNNNQLAKLTAAELEDFAYFYYYGITGEVAKKPSYVHNLYNHILRLEEHYRKKMQTMHSPFSKETTMASLFSMEASQNILHEFLEDDDTKDKTFNTGQKIKDLLKDKISDKTPSGSSALKLEMIAEIIHIINEHGNGEFRRSVETKRVSNRNFIILACITTFNVINVTLIILRYQGILS